MNQYQQMRKDCMAWVRENDIQFILELAKHFEAKLIYFGKTKDINKKGLVKWIQS